MPFTALRLAAPILRALEDEGYKIPTPIQSQAIPPVLAGRDLLGLAQTGTGKTAAFALPILHRLYVERAGAHHPEGSSRGAHPSVLILAPTRELAAQIDESFAAYGRHTRIKHTVIFGGVSQSRQVSALRGGIDVLVATPGRLIDLMGQRLVQLNHVKVFVLDEADRMLDMGFIQPIRRIAAAIPAGRQTLLFSATMPRAIDHLARSLLKDPVQVSLAPVATAPVLIEQSVYMVPRYSKQVLLEYLLKNTAMARALVFMRTKRNADRVTKALKAAGINSEAIHGNKAQNQRERTLEGFRAGRVRVLVATDLAARGLDIDNISHVVNFELPNEPEVYVHRIGRTGRMGANGVAIAFCDPDERDLLRDIEKITHMRVPVVELPELPVHTRVIPRPTRSPGARTHAGSRTAPHGAHGRGSAAARGDGRHGGRQGHSQSHAPARAPAHSHAHGHTHTQKAAPHAFGANGDSPREGAGGMGRKSSVSRRGAPGRKRRRAPRG